MKLILSYFFILLYHSPFAFSQTKCVSGRPERTHLIDQLDRAKKESPITKKIYRKYKLEPSQIEAPQTSAIKCENASVTTYTKLQAQVDEMMSHLNIDEIETQEPAPVVDHSDRFIEVEPTGSQSQPDTIIESKTRPLLFDKTCMMVGNTFEIGGVSEIQCPEDIKIKKTKLINSCLTEEILTYQNAVITNFYDCIKSLNLPVLAPEHLFKLYNRESAFNPHYHSLRGRGLGQLTSIFVHNNHQEHRGGSILEQVQSSTKSKCQIAKKVAQKAIDDPPLKKGKHNTKFDGYCAYSSIGDGLELNVLYTLVGLASSWKDDLEPLLRKYMTTHSLHENELNQVKSLVMLNAYGASGPAAAISAVKRLRGLSPSSFIKEIQKPMRLEDGTHLNQYILDLNNRGSELHKKLPPGTQAKNENEGNACINPKAL